ncbi:MAG: transcription elongation factor GreB [Gammaproteobacteria bacterium]|jgi:transcription elongation factor GreB
MGRWRPPAPRSSPYITPAGFRRLQDELNTLWQERAEVVQKLSEAAAEGDRSENAEYIYRKKQLREMDRRIRYLQKRIPDLKVVHDRPAACDRVFFGATVTLETGDGGEVAYRIVGADEFDPGRNWISVDSPMARAMLKRRLDEAFTVRLPNGTGEFVVIDISYASDGG